MILNSTSVRLFALSSTMLVTAGTSFAVPVEFDLRDTSATADIEDGSITRDGITATLSALVEGTTGTLNQTSSAFGINAAGAGDDTDELDSDNGSEAISVAFDVDVLWRTLTVSSIGAGEQGLLSIAGFAPITIAANGDYQFTSDNLVPAGQVVVLRHVVGSGFSFDSFAVEKVETPSGGGSSGSVPDAGSALGLLGASLVALESVRRRKR